MLTVSTKFFSELSTQELYAILQLRSAVFVIEQDCVYQDIDDKDQKALHVIGFKNEKVVAYTRIFKPGDYFSEAGIGRVVVAENERTYGYGYVIMEHAIKAVKSYFNEENIKISAQTYLKKFYNSIGFQQVGTEYLEDGIPHISMIKN
jgi:ElaA protein